jgi:hypothetical protein
MRPDMTRRIELWDFPSRADERRRAFASEVIDAEYHVVRQRPAIGFMSCVMIVGAAAAIVLRFVWAPIVMAFVLAGVTSVGTMAAIIIGAIILTAAWLQSRLSGRPF